MASMSFAEPTASNRPTFRSGRAVGVFRSCVAAPTHRAGVTTSARRSRQRRRLCLADHRWSDPTVSPGSSSFTSTEGSGATLTLSGGSLYLYARRTGRLRRSTPTPLIIVAISTPDRCGIEHHLPRWFRKLLVQLISAKPIAGADMKTTGARHRWRTPPRLDLGHEQCPVQAPVYLCCPPTRLS